MATVRSRSGGTYKTRKIGASVVVSRNNLGKLANALAYAGDIAARAGAKKAVREAREVYNTRGDGEWGPNAPSTIEWKGHGRVMKGRTEHLSTSLDIEPISTGVWAAGWLGDPHPDTNGRLTDGELANILENGSVRWGPISTQAQTSFSWAGGRRGAFPPRPWLSKVADNAARSEAVMAEMMAAYMAALHRKKVPTESGSADQTSLGQFDFGDLF